jgi:hypothetical protein
MLLCSINDRLAGKGGLDIPPLPDVILDDVVGYRIRRNKELDGIADDLNSET